MSVFQSQVGVRHENQIMILVNTALDAAIQLRIHKLQLRPNKYTPNHTIAENYTLLAHSSVRGHDSERNEVADVHPRC